MNRLRAGRLGSRGSTLVRAKKFIFQTPQAGSMGTGELSLMQGPRREGGHFHVSRLRISGAVPSPYPCACLTCTGTALVCLERGEEEVHFVNVTRDRDKCCS